MIRAILTPVRAAIFLVRHPSLWPLCIGPFVINVVVLVVAWKWSGSWAAPWYARFDSWTPWYGQAVDWITDAVVLIVRGLMVLILFVLVGNIACIPFNDLLSERTDRLVTGWRDEGGKSWARWAMQMAFTAYQELRRLALFLTVALVLFALALVPGVAAVAVPLQLASAATFFALDYLAYPLERRGMLRLDEKLAFLRRNAARALPFGFSMILLFMMPFINFLFIPLAVVGGTLVHGDAVDRRQHRR